MALATELCIIFHGKSAPNAMMHHELILRFARVQRILLSGGELSGYSAVCLFRRPAVVFLRVEAQAGPILRLNKGAFFTAPICLRQSQKKDTLEKGYVRQHSAYKWSSGHSKFRQFSCSTSKRGQFESKGKEGCPDSKAWSRQTEPAPQNKFCW